MKMSKKSRVYVRRTMDFNRERAMLPWSSNNSLIGSYICLCQPPNKSLLFALKDNRPLAIKYQKDPFGW